MRRNPPPSTPTPRRFLPAKQRTATTPAPHPQFRSTPRFASSSAPRPTQTGDSLVEDVDDEGEDDEELTDSSAAAACDNSRPPHTQDSIEVESGGAGTSQGEDGRSPDRESDIDEDAGLGAEAEAADLLDTEAALSDLPSSPEQRQAKKRRISISPVGGSSPPPGHYEDAESVFGKADATESVNHGDPAHPGDAATAEARQAQQPVFRPAPRFKPTANDIDAAASQGMLPAAFSPQRRGAKYLPGGLAAELQGWLSEAKGWDSAERTAVAANGEDGGDVSTMRIVVGEVRPGRHMHLVRGRLGADATARGFILAGQGRLTGLGGWASMAEGSVVILGPPVWDTEIDGCVWTVACDWRVV